MEVTRASADLPSAPAGPRRRALTGAAFVLTAAAVAFCHLDRLADIPRGLFWDEASIGYNALSLLETGRDEKGEAWPLYFHAEGDYKNPVQGYLVVALFRLLGPSDAHLRLSSALLFLTAFGLFAWLLRRLFPDRPGLWLYGWISFGFMPHFFNLSRIGFEPIALLPLLVAALLAIRATFEGTSGPSGVRAFLTGLLIGLAAYAYQPARLFSAFVLAATIASYFARSRLRAFASVIGGYAVALLPLLAFMRSHPGALTGRFADVSYLPDPRLSLGQKLFLLAHNYAVHFSPRFLMFTGDGNLRHTPGVGVAFWTCLVLAVAGLLAIVRTPALRAAPFVRLVVVLLLLAPIPPALTASFEGHVMRSLPLSLFLLIISCFGIEWVVAWARHREWLIYGAFTAVLLVEAGGDMVQYFVVYPEQSAPVFFGSGYPEMLEAAEARHPREIRYQDSAEVPAFYSYAEYYRRLLHLPATPPIVSGNATAVPGTCMIYFFHQPPRVPAGVRITAHLEEPGRAVRLMCFE